MIQLCLVSSTPYISANIAFADVFLRKMNGGAQSSLVGASDGNFYVLKSAGNPQGPNTLFNEALGSILADYLGLPVPQWCPVYVDATFIQRNQNLWFTTESGERAPSPGWHFGSKFAIGTPDSEVYEIVPHRWMERVAHPGLFAGVMLVDIWAENADRRQVLFIERSADRDLDVLFFDHGHMFRGPDGTKKLTSTRACLYYHRGIYRRAFELGEVDAWLSRIQNVNEKILRDMMERVPHEWRNRALENGTIDLLMTNQQSLSQTARKIEWELVTELN